MEKQHIVVLGGCGQVGSCLTTLLLDHTNYLITITHVRINKIHLFHNQVNSKHKSRVRVVYADTSDIMSLRAAFQNTRLVIVAISSQAFSQNIVSACLKEGCDYIDILEPVDVINKLLLYKKDIEENKRLFITQGGLAPGLPAVLLRFIHERYKAYKKIRMGAIMSFKKSTKPEQAYDVFDFVLKKKSVIFKNGKWEYCNGKKAKKTINYGNRFGNVISIPVNFHELDELPAKYGLDYFSCYGAAPNIQMYFILKSLLTFLYKIKPGFGWHPLAKLLLYQSKKNKKEPEGFALVVDAWKSEITCNPELKLILEHRDNYYTTAVATLLLVKEYFAGMYNQMYGIHCMGHLVSTGILQNLTDFGITLDIMENEYN